MALENARHPRVPITQAMGTSAAGSARGVVFGLWLAGIFFATVTSHLSQAKQISINLRADNDSYMNALTLLAAIIWPSIYLAFARGSSASSSLRKSSALSLGVFLFFSMTSILLSQQMLLSLAYWALTAATLWICLRFCKLLTDVQLEAGLKVYASTIAILLIAYSYWEYVPGQRLGEGRGSIEPATIGMVSMTGVLAAMTFRNGLARYAIIAALVVTIYLTQSRAPALGTLIGLLIIQLIRIRAGSAASKVMAAMAVLIGGVLAFVYFEDIWPHVDRFFAIRDEHRGIQSGGSGRLAIWSETLNLFLENPVFGIGYRAHEGMLRVGSSSHNGYLALLAEIGLFGFLAVAYLIISGLWRLGKIQRQSDAPIFTLSVLVGIAFAYLFLAMFERFLVNSGNPTSILFLVAILWGAVSRKQNFVGRKSVS